MTAFKDPVTQNFYLPGHHLYWLIQGGAKVGLQCEYMKHGVLSCIIIY